MHRFMRSGVSTWTFLGLGCFWFLAALWELARKQPIDSIGLCLLSGIAFFLLFIHEKRTPVLSLDENGITRHGHLLRPKRRIAWTDVAEVTYSRFHGTLILSSSGKNKVSFRPTEIRNSDKERLVNVILEALEKHSSPEVYQEARTVLSQRM